MGQIEINHTGSGGGVVLSSDGTNLLLGGSAVGGGGFDSDLTIDGKTANYTIVAGDAGKIISHSDNDVTFTFTAAATLGAGWHCWVKNRAGDTDVTTFDFNGSEKLDGLGNGKLFTGESIHVYCDGSNFHSVDRTIMWAGNTDTDYYAQPIAQGGGSIAGGLQSNASGTTSVAVGFSTTASHTNSSAIGYGSIAASTRAMALGWSRAGGTDSLSAQIGTSSSSYGATGANSVAIGYQAKATSSKSVSIGERVNTTNSYSYSLGSQIDNGGQYSAVLSGYDVTISGGSYNVAIGTTLDIDAVNGGMAFGNQSSVTKDYSMAFGRYAHTNIKGQFAFSGHGLGGKSMSDRANGCIYILYSDTTDATAEAMTTTNSTAAADNQIAAPTNDTCIMFSGTVVAIQNGAQDQGGWEIKGLLKNDGGTTTLVNSEVKTFADGNGWSIVLSADNTNNALKVQCTGEASHNIRWVANIQTSEVTYA